MATRLRTTQRSDLRPSCGANTHFCFNPSVYSKGPNPNALIVQALVELQIGYVRERYWPHNPAQQKAFAALADAGIGFYLFMCDVNSTPDSARSNVAALANSSIAPLVLAVCGPNEPNAYGGPTWVTKCMNIQQAIFTEAAKHASLRGAAVVGPALKHNVANLDRDYQALGAAGITRWCDAGDFHFYPGNAGPSGNAREEQRAGQAYGALPLWQSETGWTGADTDPKMAARFTVEAYVRNYLTGMVGTSIYEFADESQYVSGREGLFGMRKPVEPKQAFLDVLKLLATPDGDEEFVGALGSFERGVGSDAEAVVTSEGRGHWTVYLLRASQRSAELVLPPSYLVDNGTLTRRGAGASRYTVQLQETMTTVHVQPALATAAAPRDEPVVPAGRAG